LKKNGAEYTSKLSKAYFAARAFASIAEDKKNAVKTDDNDEEAEVEKNPFMKKSKRVIKSPPRT